MLNNFMRDEQGQDIIEYTLLLAFVALAASALFISMSTSLTAVWNNASSKLAAGATQGS